MEHESFSDPDTAAILNDNFVSIKVDREERPDLDQIYQTVCQMVTRSGGWPLSVWLTPDQRPFYVGTYYPPQERYGRPGFKQVLLALSRAYREKPDEVARVSANWTESIALTDAPPDAAETVPGRQLLADAARSMAARMDRTHGGFSGAPKFPSAYSWDVLLRHYAHTGDELFLKLVTETLSHMATRGLYDQLGGGFHRYSVDAHWAVPHFEKMLYDNASLPPLYLSAWQATGEPLFRRIAAETLTYVLRKMTHPEGGFYSTTDADSEGEEGKFFAFNREEVFEAVGDGLGDLMCRYYGVTDEGNFEHTGKTVLHVAYTPTPDEEPRIAEGRRLMLAYRERRVPPFRDEKILTAWNGLMISAMARGGRILRDAAFTGGARRAADFVLEHLTTEDGSLLRRYKDGKAGIPGYVEDYAYFTAGLIDLYEATFDEQYLQAAIRYARDTVRLFYDGQGGFFLTQEGGEALIHRPKDASDQSTPAGSSISVINLLRLAPHTGDDSAREIAEAALRTYESYMAKMPSGMGSMLQALDLYHSGPTEVTLIGDTREEWLEQLGRHYLPNLVLARRAPLQGAPSLTVCRNFACSAPVTSWDDAARLLD